MPPTPPGASTGGMVVDTSAGTPSIIASRWEAVASRAYDAVLSLGERRGMAARRSALLSAANGTVLEIGAGTGLNLSAFPSVDRLILSEPSPQMRLRLDRRVARSGRVAEVVDAAAASLPVETGSVDTVVSTLVLCTVPDPDAALAEVSRVLRPGGRLLFLEHVRAPAGSREAWWQDRFVKQWEAFALGCRCDRDLVAVVGRHLTIDTVHEDTWRGMPPVVRPLVLGSAHRP